MSLIKHFFSIVRHLASAGSSETSTLPSLTPRSVMLAASVMAAAVTGTASASEREAADFFVAKVVVVQSSHVASHGQPGPMPDRRAYESAQDQFIDQVLRGRLPETGATGRNMNAPSNNPASWPDVGFLRPMSPR